MLKKHGISNLLFQSAIEKYNEHPVFQAKIEAVKQQDAAAKKPGALGA